MKNLLAAAFVLSLPLGLGCGGATPPATTYSISGTIFGAASATVNLTGVSTAQVTTSGTGTYSFAGLASGSYTVTPTKTGYTFSPVNRAISLSADSAGNDFTGSAVPTQITLTATLTDSPPAAMEGRALTAAAATVWSGYRLSCVTFGTPPVSATGTADATGHVSLTMAAQNVAFGCFVLDATGTAVATLIVTSGAQSSQTVMFSASADLGTVSVSLSLGTAFALLPASGTLVTTTPPGTPCPIGTWVMSDTHVSEFCPPYTIYDDLVIERDAAGVYFTSSTIYNSTEWGSHCQPVSWARVTTTYVGNTLEIGPIVSTVPGCVGKTVRMMMTVDSSCQSMVGTVVESSCPPGCGCKTSIDVPVTRR